MRCSLRSPVFGRGLAGTSPKVASRIKLSMNGQRMPFMPNTSVCESEPVKGRGFRSAKMARSATLDRRRPPDASGSLRKPTFSEDARWRSALTTRHQPLFAAALTHCAVPAMADQFAARRRWIRNSPTFWAEVDQQPVKLGCCPLRFKVRLAALLTATVHADHQFALKECHDSPLRTVYRPFLRRSSPHNEQEATAPLAQHESGSGTSACLCV